MHVAEKKYYLGEYQGVTMPVICIIDKNKITIKLYIVMIKILLMSYHVPSTNLSTSNEPVYNIMYMKNSNQSDQNSRRV